LNGDPQRGRKLGASPLHPIMPPICHPMKTHLDGLCCSSLGSQTYMSRHSAPASARSRCNCEPTQEPVRMSRRPSRVQQRPSRCVFISWQADDITRARGGVGREPRVHPIFSRPLRVGRRRVRVRERWDRARGSEGMARRRTR
jgi:hypothetical protein